MIRWKPLDYSQLVLYEDLKYYVLNPPSRRSVIVDAVMKAQDLFLPRDQWRNRQSVENGMYHSKTLMLGLQEAVARIPAPPPVPVVTAPPPPPQKTLQEMLGEFLMPLIKQAVREVLADLPTGHQGPILAPNLTPPAPPAVPRPRVDVMGLLGGQADIVRKAYGQAFNLKFIESSHHRQEVTAPVAILCTKFINHSMQERAIKAGAKIIYANGGTESVINCLKELTH